MIRDFNIESLEKRVWIPSWTFQTWAKITPGTNDGINGAGAGTPETISEIGTSGIAVPRAGAAGDEWMHAWMAPWDLDIKKQIRFRVWWTSSSTDADTPLWKVFYSALAEDGAIIQPATALDTVIATDTALTTANSLQGTEIGVINRNTLADTVYFLNLTVEADNLGGASANELGFYGLEVRYTPRRTAGPRRNILGGRRLVTTRPLGVQLASAQEGL